MFRLTVQSAVLTLAVLLHLTDASASVYCRHYLATSRPEVEWRLHQKDKWRRADQAPLGALAERRVKMRTNLERQQGQWGGLDESADPAPPFVLHESDPRPPGLKPGVYWLNSGRYGFYSETVNRGLRGGTRATERFELVYMHRTRKGKIVTQMGKNFGAADSSWGWDGRFEFQPRPDGTQELIVTQGAMELPSRLEGAAADDGDLPELARHNNTRSRHVFRPIKFEDGKLYMLDEGSILENRPDTSGDWLIVEAEPVTPGSAVHRLKSAHGYGENYLPDEKDPRKMWLDEFGYPVRVFDLVTREVQILRPDGQLHKIPATTRPVAYRMDPRNPSRRVPPGTLLPNGKAADEGIVIVSEELPELRGGVARSTVRMGDVETGKVREERVLRMDGTVEVRRDPGKVKPPTLIEGFNPVPGVVTLPSGRRVYLGMFSASEFSAGAVPERGPKQYRYGAYLAYRPAEEGPLGPYTPVTEMTEQGVDLADTLEDLTELIGASWGIGRPQVYRDGIDLDAFAKEGEHRTEKEFRYDSVRGRYWMDAHFVDVDLLSEGLPKFGYPKRPEEFANAYRRHKVSIPIVWTERNGLPWLEVDDPEVAEALRKFREEKAAKRRRTAKSRKAA